MAGETRRLEVVEAPLTEVVLVNPGRLNAMDPAFFDELAAVFTRIGESRATRAVLLRAEGRAFSIGLDKELSMTLLPDERPGEASGDRAALLHDTIRHFQATMMAVRHCRRPVIAAVNGFCFGGGLDLACAADIRLCSADAQFAVLETRIAMVADLGTLSWLPRIVGRGTAREMAFTGAPVGAERAAAIGLVNAVCADREQLLETARGLGADIVRNAPRTVRIVKQLMNDAELAEDERQLRQVALYNSGHFFSADLREGYLAAKERREPIWANDEPFDPRL